MGLRVLCIVSILPPYPGGAAVCFGNILQELAHGHEDDLESVVVLTEKGCLRDYGGAVRVHDRLFRYDSTGLNNRSFFKQLLNYLIILFYILFARKEMVHIHARYVYARYIGRVVWLALLVTRTKVVVDTRDRFYTNFGFGHNFLVCSRELEEFYGWIGKKEFLPIPMSFPELRKDIEMGHRVAYIGAIVENKGVIELLDGYAQYLKESKDPLELHIWGQNTLGGRFEEKARMCGAVYHGAAAPGEVFDRILESKAVILPSSSEGMPRVLLETICCKRAFICHSSVKSLASLLPEGFVLKEITPREIKRAFFEVEAHKGEVCCQYDLLSHSRALVASGLIGFYKRVLSKEWKQKERYSIKLTE